MDVRRIRIAVLYGNSMLNSKGSAKLFFKVAVLFCILSFLDESQHSC